MNRPAAPPDDPGRPVPPAADAAPGPPLGPARQLALFGRSLLLQASWSFERMQSLGFAFLLAGEGRRLARGAADPAAASRAFLERSLAYFNTNPPMAGYIAGAALRLEEESVADPGRLAELVRFKRGAVSALAAWGDTLFWATLRPAATLLAALIAWFGGAWGAAGYLIVYNAVHLHYRVRGLQDGYRWGPAVAGRVGRSPIRRLPDLARRAGLVAFGVLVPLSAAGTVRQLGPAPGAAVVLLALLFGGYLRRRPGIGYGWGFAAIAAGFAYALRFGGR